MPAPRMDEGRLSPITQRSASSRLDLPQPFGPTMPVNPGSIRSSVGSTKDLKPLNRRRGKFKGYFLLFPPGALFFYQRIHIFFLLVIFGFSFMLYPAVLECGRRVYSI